MMPLGTSRQPYSVLSTEASADMRVDISLAKLAVSITAPNCGGSRKPIR